MSKQRRVRVKIESDWSSGTTSDTIRAEIKVDANPGVGLNEIARLLDELVGQARQRLGISS